MTPTLMLALSYFGVPLSTALGTVVLKTPRLLTRAANGLTSPRWEDMKIMRQAVDLRAAAVTVPASPGPGTRAAGAHRR